MKRLFDIIAALLGLVLLSPFLIILSAFVALSGKGGVFFIQQRVGLDGKLFGLYKFRSMHPGSEAKGQLTVGERDPRVTKIGLFLRKYKLDELPQLINVLKGEMSVVGPRPEVPRYVELYSEEQMRVLTVRPGLTDYASLTYFDEDKLLGEAENSEEVYIQEIMPQKLNLNLQYIDERNFVKDLKLIFLTLIKILRRA
ncbi:MAG: sugar transferase [Flavobacteriales bacterium]|nr:sugar transferase [Flavobacteriales bacterium]